MHPTREARSIFIMKNVKLIHGDCLEKMKDIPDGSIDMVMADPPYGTTACSWDSIIPLKPMWEQLKRVSKPNGAIVMTASQPFTTTLIASNMKMFKYCWVWDKGRGVGHLNAKKRPMMQTEDICVFYDKQVTYNQQMRERGKPRTSKNNATQQVYGKTKDNFVGETLAKKYPINIVEFSKSAQSEMLLHPTQKPVALMEYLIKTYTNQGETVLDFCMGSGTTGVACVNLNRKFIGIELDEFYFDDSCNRIDPTYRKPEDKKIDDYLDKFFSK